MTQNEIIEMAKQAVSEKHEKEFGTWFSWKEIEAFAKLVAAHAVAKDRKEFDIDELCARQNKIGYKQGYNAGVLAEREACAKVCELESGDGPDNGCCPTYWNEAQEACAKAIRARGEPTSRGSNE